MTDPVKYLLSMMHTWYIRELKEQINAAVYDSSQYASRQYPGPAEPHARGQLRHHSLAKALSETAKVCRLPCTVRQTSPPGGCYTLVEIGRMSLGLGNVNHQFNKMPRKTKFRKRLAAKNAWLCPVQLNLFFRVEDPPEGEIFAMIIVSVDRSDPMKVEWAGIGIPTPDLSGWVALRSLDELIRLGASPEFNEPGLRDQLVEIKDEAIPKLKH